MPPLSRFAPFPPGGTTPVAWQSQLHGVRRHGLLRGLPTDRARHQTYPESPMRAVLGFTLVELLVAIAVMALLAIVSWRGLDGMARSEQQARARRFDAGAPGRQIGQGQGAALDAVPDLVEARQRGRGAEPVEEGLQLGVVRSAVLRIDLPDEECAGPERAYQ